MSAEDGLREAIERLADEYAAYEASAGPTDLMLGTSRTVLATNGVVGTLRALLAEHQPTAREAESYPNCLPSLGEPCGNCHRCQPARDTATSASSVKPMPSPYAQPAPVAPAGEVRQEGFVLRVPTDREPNDDGALNRGRNYVDAQVVIQPDLDKRGEHRPGYGGSVIALREWNEQVFLHELLHVATAYSSWWADPQRQVSDPYGHDIISRIEVALWETGWRYEPDLAVRLAAAEERLAELEEIHGTEILDHADTKDALAAAEQRVDEAQAATWVGWELKVQELTDRAELAEQRVAAVRRLLRFEYVSAVDLAAALADAERARREQAEREGRA